MPGRAWSVDALSLVRLCVSHSASGERAARLGCVPVRIGPLSSRVSQQPTPNDTASTNVRNEKQKAMRAIQLYSPLSGDFASLTFDFEFPLHLFRI